MEEQLMEVTEAEITRPIPPGGSLAEQFPSASPPPLFRREPPAHVIKMSRRRLCIIFEPGKQGPERNVPRKTAWNERPKKSLHHSFCAAARLVPDIAVSQIQTRTGRARFPEISQRSF